MKKYISSLLLLLTSTVCLWAHEIPQAIQENFQVVKNLKEEWLKVDKNNQYVPFIGKNDSSTPVVGVVINLVQYSGNNLLCCIPSGSSVLIDQQIVGYYGKNTCVQFDIDSLQQVYNQEQVLVAVYAPYKSYENLDFLIIKNNNEIGAGVKNISLKRESSSLEDFFVVGLLFMLISYAFQINQFPNTFKKLYDFGDVFSLKIREENVKIRLMNEAHIAFLVHHCLLIAYLLVLLISTNSLIDLSMVVDQPYTFSEFIIAWLKLALGVFLIMWLKYIIVIMFGSLFGLRNFKYMHVFDFMRMSLIFWSVLFIAMILIFSGFVVTNPLYVDILIYIFIAFAVVRILILYYRLFAGTTFRNMYLFSYICTSEIIPLLVGVELFID